MWPPPQLVRLELCAPWGNSSCQPHLSWHGTLPSCTGPLVHRVSSHTWGLHPMPVAVVSRPLPSSLVFSLQLPPSLFKNQLTQGTLLPGRFFWCFQAKEDEEAFLGGLWGRQILWRPDRVRCSLVFAPEAQTCTYGAGLAQMLSVRIGSRSGESVEEQGMQTQIFQQLKPDFSNTHLLLLH